MSTPVAGPQSHSPQFVLAYAPPRWPALPEEGTALVAPALVGGEPIGYLAYAPGEALAFYVTDFAEATRATRTRIDAAMADTLAAELPLADAHSAVIGAATFGPMAVLDIKTELRPMLERLWGFQ